MWISRHYHARVNLLYYTKYDPILVFEGKRLPPPKNDPNREREYVIGGKIQSGGIQRFKLGLHGAEHQVVALVGYIQAGEPREWLKRINGWIRDLEGTLGFDGERWTPAESLVDFTHDVHKRVASAWSTHSRVGTVITRNIQIRHLWVRMID